MTEPQFRNQSVRLVLLVGKVPKRGGQVDEVFELELLFRVFLRWTGRVAFDGHQQLPLVEVLVL